jgi:AmpE protein
MSLLSLLIALAAEKSFSSAIWRFDYYYQKYLSFFKNNAILAKLKRNNLSYTIFILLPVAVVYGVLYLVEDGLLHLIISTLILIVAFGCVKTRGVYKQYLHASFQGEKTTAALHHKQLLQDKNLPDMGFGQALIWLNYRYYIAIMLFFVVFGAAGVVFYRLLTTVIEQQNGCSIETETNHIDEEVLDSSETPLTETTLKSDDEQSTTVSDELNNNDDEHNVDQPFHCKSYQQLLFFIDWLPVRITSFGYMFVGHFSKALPIWLESLFDLNKPTYKILIDVAQKSEDFMIDKDDCSAEPCLLVRLAKRNVLLLLSVISILTLLGLVN